MKAPMTGRFYFHMLLAMVCVWLSLEPLAFAKEVAAKPAAKIDPRAIAVFQRAMEQYKGFKSLHMEANELIDGGGTPPLLRTYAVSLQMPLRARFDISEGDITGKNQRATARHLVNETQYVAWHSKIGETRRELKSSAQRQAAITEVFKDAPLLALSVVSFCGGINPARTPIVQKATFEIDWEDGKEFEVVHLTISENSTGKTSDLIYYFSPTDHLLRHIILAREHSNRIQTLLLELRSQKENSEATQSDTDARIYSWEPTKAQ